MKPISNVKCQLSATSLSAGGNKNGSSLYLPIRSIDELSPNRASDVIVKFIPPLGCFHLSSVNISLGEFIIKNKHIYF